MFACIHASADPALLIACAEAFSPVVEQTAPDIAVLDASGLDRIHGPAHEIAAALTERARAMGFTANIAIASNPDAAICAARGFSGTSIVPDGDEAKFLESLRLDLLEPGEEILETFDRWGIRTFRDLSLLPTIGIAGRLGPEGVRLQKLARGEFERPLAPLEEPLRFQEEMELDYPVELLEPLSFLLARLLGEICGRLESRGLATNEVRLRLGLEDRSEHTRALRLPVPMRDPRTFLKLLQLDLGSHPPGAPVVRVHVVMEPVKPRVAQDGLFVLRAPEPEKLELTLARVAALVGEENLGTPELLDTHRPDAFRMHRFNPARESATRGPRADEGVRPTELRSRKQAPPERRLQARLPAPQSTLAFRYYRPALCARVSVEDARPVFVLAGEIRGKVASVRGPWRTSGDWWTVDPWDRDEWDVSLHDGALYRIYCELATGRWFVEGSYD